MTPFERKLRGQLAELAAAGHSRASAAVEMGAVIDALNRALRMVEGFNEQL